MIKTEILRLFPVEQNRQIVLYAADIIKNGGIISFPTDTVYALGADVMNREAVEKVFKLKRRERDKPFAIFLPDDAELKRFVRDISSFARKLMQRFWPGPLTIIFNSKSDELAHLTSKENKLGVRVSSSDIIQLLLRKTQRPLTATSANLSGSKESISAEDVYRHFHGKIELIIDGGPAVESIPSSVVDVSGEIPILLREGRISFEELKSVVPEIKIMK